MRRSRGGCRKCIRRLRDSVIDGRLARGIVHGLNNGQSLTSGPEIGPTVARFKGGPNIHRTSIAILAPATIPTFAVDKVMSRHEVRCQDQVCGDIKDNGIIRRFVHAIPEAKYIPESNPDERPSGQKLADNLLDLLLEGLPQAKPHRPYQL